MPRKLSKPRPKQGARLYRLRTAAGLSQAELARAIGVSQQNIAFWEQSEKIPRSDLLPKIAEALGVSVEDLLLVKASKGAAAPAARPTAKMRAVVERVAQLPRRQQDHIAEFVLGYVERYESAREAGR
jgi:transcriptional regulator with XRE-family HTH domain